MIQNLTIKNWTPLLLNPSMRKHWRSRNKSLRDQGGLIRVFAMLQMIHPAGGRRRVSLEVHGWPSGRLPDADAFDKLLLDALVAAGLLVDDDDAGVEGRMQVKIVRSKERKTIITLEDCDEKA